MHQIPPTVYVRVSGEFADGSGTWKPYLSKTPTDEVEIGGVLEVMENRALGRSIKGTSQEVRDHLLQESMEGEFVRMMLAKMGNRTLPAAVICHHSDTADDKRPHARGCGTLLLPALLATLIIIIAAILH